MVQQIEELKQTVGLAPAVGPPPPWAQCLNKHHYHSMEDSAPCHSRNFPGACRIRGPHARIKHEIFTIKYQDGSWRSDGGYWGESEYTLYRRKVPALGISAESAEAALMIDIWVMRQHNDPSRGSYRGSEDLFVARAGDSLWPPLDDAWKKIPKIIDPRFGWHVHIPMKSNSQEFSEFVRSAFPPLVVKSLQRLCWFRVWISAHEKSGILPYDVIVTVAKLLSRRAENLEMVERWWIQSSSLT
eukprot:SAG31_NODE_5297_length_2625_cov_2.764450_2_plen_243_part_00